MVLSIVFYIRKIPFRNNIVECNKNNNAIDLIFGDFLS